MFNRESAMNSDASMQEDTTIIPDMIGNEPENHEIDLDRAGLGIETVTNLENSEASNENLQEDRLQPPIMMAAMGNPLGRGRRPGGPRA